MTLSSLVLQGWRVQNLSRQPIPLLDCPCEEEISPYIQSELYVTYVTRWGNSIREIQICQKTTPPHYLPLNYHCFTTVLWTSTRLNILLHG